MRCDTCESDIWPTRYKHHKTYCNEGNHALARRKSLARKAREYGKPNQRKQSPIPWLALRMAIFNGCDCKQAQAKARATLADRLYALSQQERTRV